MRAARHAAETAKRQHGVRLYAIAKREQTAHNSVKGSKMPL